jgi:ribonuclease BN (tRNA processing enzyme)
MPTSDAYVDLLAGLDRHATDAGVRRLLLTHLQPGTDPAAARAAAGDSYDRPIDIATADLVVDLP